MARTMAGTMAGTMARRAVDTVTLGTAGTVCHPETRLYSDGVVSGVDGGPVVVPPGSALRRIAGTGFLDLRSGGLPGAAVPGRGDIAAARRRLQATVLPGTETFYQDMAERALVDIDVLTFPNGACVAAASPYWRYVWPRDAGFVAVALTALGRTAQARRLLEFVARVQEDDGAWQARYLPDGSGDVPDSRGVQLDGIGWTLWACWVLTQALGRVPETLERPVVRALDAGVAALEPATGLPRPSPDYWETDVDEPTLGTAAPLLLGLRAGRELAGMLDDPERAASAGVAADTLAAAVETHFAPHGYGRRASGAGGLDASVSFLLPPFTPERPAVRRAWQRARIALAVPNGGVRPGEEWPDQETAWTPQVSLFALTAAAVGDTATAHHLLSWLDARRTRLGALPEKVTAAGRPAAVAPLGLTGAGVLIALATLDGRTLPIPSEESTHG